MKKYTATAVLSYIVNLDVEAENITEAEQKAGDLIAKGEGTKKLVEQPHEHVTAEPADAVKAPNVCIACEG